MPEKKYKDAKWANKNQSGGQRETSLYNDEFDQVLGCKVIVTFKHVTQAGCEGENIVGKRKETGIRPGKA